MQDSDSWLLEVENHHNVGSAVRIFRPIGRRGSGPPKHYHEEQDEQFFRDLEKRGEYFGNGSADDKELVHRLYGIVNVGPPLKL